MLFLYYGDKGGSRTTKGDNKEDVVKDSLVKTIVFSQNIDMENLDDVNVSSHKSYSGQKSNKLSSTAEYSIGFSKPLKQINSFSTILKTDITVQVFSEIALKEALIVLSIDSPGQKNILWKSFPLNSIHHSKKWNTVSTSFEIDSAFLKSENQINVYIWNKAKEEFFVDDLTISFVGIVPYVLNNSQPETNFNFDFESLDGLTKTECIAEATARSGKKACVLNSQVEYGPSIIKKLSEVTRDSIRKISMSIWMLPLEDDPNFSLYVTIENQIGKNIFYGEKSTEKSKLKKNVWSKFNASFNLPASQLALSDVISVNIWNKGKNMLIVDDLLIVYGEPQQRKGTPPIIDQTLIYQKRFKAPPNHPPFKTHILKKANVNLSELNTFNTNDEFLSGNFNADITNLDELLCIKNDQIIMYGYNKSTNSFEKIWEESKKSKSNWWSKNNKRYAGDFNEDGYDDLLLIDIKTGNWEIITFSNGWSSYKLSILGASRFEPGILNFFVTGVFSPSQQDQLACFVKPTKLRLFSFSKKSGVFVDNIITHNDSKVPFNPASDIFFTVKFDDNKEYQLLKLNLDWRFDLTLLEYSNSDFTVKNKIDFKGYRSDFNPKYYELTKIVPGNFITPHRSSVIVISCNCKDVSFTNNYCKNIESLDFLPNSINLYDSTN
jgi:hypothetical protein